MIPQRIEDIPRWNANLYPDKEALRFGNRSLTHRELHKAIDAFAQRLMRQGVCQNSRIGILLKDPIDYVISYFSALACGGIAVPYAPDMGQGEILADRKNIDLEFLICAEDEDRFPSSDRQIAFRYGADIEEEETRVVSCAECSGDDIAVLLATSGTSGCPKRVMLTHKAVLANAQAHGDSLGYSTDDRALIVLPLAFSFSHTAQVVSHLLFGGTLIFLKGTFTPALFWLHLAKYEITHVALVPALLTLLLTQPEARREIPALRLVSYGAAPLAVAKFEEVRQFFPASIRFAHTYGQTEAGPRISTLCHKEIRKRPDSVGLPLAGVTVTIVDERGLPVNRGETGEICVSAASVMQGYYNDPIQTARVLKGRTLLTGDLGYKDADGFLYIVGRKRNMILSGGFNIYPEEIETCLEGSGFVQESYVYSDRDDILGEIVVADVVLHQGIPVSETALRDYLFHKLGVRKIPKRFRYVAEVAKNKNNKKVRLTR